MLSRKKTLMLFGLAFLMSVLANIVREEAKEREKARLAQAIAVADSAVTAPAPSGPLPLVHHSTLAPAGDAPKRAGPPLCAYHPGDEQRLGRVVSGRLGPDGVTELVTVRLDAPAPDGATTRELPAPDSVLVSDCGR